MGRFRVSMDIGGTFTDVVAYDEDAGAYAAGKASTTPDEPDRGRARRRSSRSSTRSPRSTSSSTARRSGSTRSCSGAASACCCSPPRGAGDVYQIARGDRTRLYDLHYRKPPPLVPRRDIVEIGGRLDWRGERARAARRGRAVRAAAGARRDGGLRRGRRRVPLQLRQPGARASTPRRSCARQLDGVTVSLSHRVAPRVARVRAHLVDGARRLHRAERRALPRAARARAARAQASRSPLHVMQSNGGVMTAATARERPFQTLLSGPVGGTIGGAALARALGRPNLICVDMGGTSFDVSLVVDGQPRRSTETSLEGLPLLMPIVEHPHDRRRRRLLAYVEAGGLRVGPESAGADPGPACYGRGGTAADRHRREPRARPASTRTTSLGGRMALDADAARERRRASSARELGLDAAALAEGIVDVINAKMAQAIRTLTVEQGIEPRDFALVAFGGAGPMHAAFLAAELGIGEVIVPRLPGRVLRVGDAADRASATTSRSLLPRARRRSTSPSSPRLLARARGRGPRGARERGRRDGRRVASSTALDMRYVGAGVHRAPSTVGRADVDRASSRRSSRASTRRTTSATGTPTPARRSSSSPSAPRRSATSAAPSPERIAPPARRTPARGRATSSSTAQRSDTTGRPPRRPRRRARSRGPAISSRSTPRPPSCRRAARVASTRSAPRSSRSEGRLTRCHRRRRPDHHRDHPQRVQLGRRRDERDADPLGLHADHLRDEGLLGRAARRRAPGARPVGRACRSSSATSRSARSVTEEMFGRRGLAAGRRLDHQRLVPGRHPPERHHGLRADLPRATSWSASPPRAPTGSTSARRTPARRWTRPRSTRRASGSARPRSSRAASRAADIIDLLGRNSRLSVSGDRRPARADRRARGRASGGSRRSSTATATRRSRAARDEIFAQTRARSTARPSAAIPDGVYHAEGSPRQRRRRLGRPVPVRLRVEIAGDDDDDRPRATSDDAAPRPRQLRRGAGDLGLPRRLQAAHQPRPARRTAAPSAPLTVQRPAAARCSAPRSRSPCQWYFTPARPADRPRREGARSGAARRRRPARATATR